LIYFMRLCEPNVLDKARCGSDDECIDSEKPRGFDNGLPLGAVSWPS